MTIPQTTYPENMAAGVEGQLADGGVDAHIKSRVNTNEDMFFGCACEAVLAAENEVRLPGAGTSAVFAGVAVHTHAIDAFDIAEGIPTNNPVNLLTKGRVLVIPEVAVTAMNDPVYYRFQNAGALPEKVGRFNPTNDGASGDVRQVTAGASWGSLAAGGALAILEVNLPA